MTADQALGVGSGIKTLTQSRSHLPALVVAGPGFVAAKAVVLPGEDWRGETRGGRGAGGQAGLLAPLRGV